MNFVQCLLLLVVYIYCQLTRLDSDILDEEVAIPGYSILRCDRDRRGRGVALYISDTIDYIPFVNNVNIEAAVI